VPQFVADDVACLSRHDTLDMTGLETESCNAVDMIKMLAIYFSDTTFVARFTGSMQIFSYFNASIALVGEN